MSDEMKHSPLPWSVVHDDDLPGDAIDDAEGKEMAVAAPHDAQFIVTACNSYYDNRAAIAELVEALEWAYETLGELNPSNYSHECVCELNNKSVEVILGLKPLIAKHKAGK